MKKKCPHSSCKNLIPYQSKYCTEHEKQKTNTPAQTKYIEHNFYNKAVWRRTSKSIRQQYPICQKCNHFLSDVVDHIYEIRWPEGELYSLDIRNLIAICHGCHNKKTNEVQRTIIQKENNQNEITNETLRYLKKYCTTLEQLSLIEEIQERRKGT